VTRVCASADFAVSFLAVGFFGVTFLVAISIHLLRSRRVLGTTRTDGRILARRSDGAVCRRSPDPA
jgi:hypothetical protein